MELNYKDPSREIRIHLSANERLEWAGMPKQGFHFKSNDKFMIPFSLFWCGIVVFWESMAYLMDAPLFFLIFGIPFLLIGIQLLFGRFITDAISRKNMYYGITNERIIQVSGKKNKSVRSIKISDLSDITYTEKPDGSGLIMIGPGTEIESKYGQRNYKTSVSNFTLDLIPDVRKVYNKILEIQKRTFEQHDNNY